MTKSIRAHSHATLIIALIIGTIAAILFPDNWRWITRLLIGWNITSYFYLISMTLLASRIHPSMMKKIAEKNDENAFTLLSIMSIGALASLAAILFELATIKQMPPTDHFMYYALTGSTIIGSWFLIAAIFGFHYAHMFYHALPDRHLLTFPEGTDQPSYWDFLYFSLTIAMTAQTSDIVIASADMRRPVLAQACLSFLFNIVILGFSINIFASLIGQ